MGRINGCCTYCQVDDRYKFCVEQSKEDHVSMEKMKDEQAQRQMAAVSHDDSLNQSIIMDGCYYKGEMKVITEIKTGQKFMVQHGKGL